MTATRTAPKPTRKPAAKREKGPAAERRGEVKVVKLGADRSFDWTPRPPDEESHYAKFVEVEGGDFDPSENPKDAIQVRMQQSDPAGRSLYLNIYARHPGSGERSDFESFVVPEQVRQIHDALGAAIEQAEKIGLLPPRQSAPAPELRVHPFEYVGVRGSAGEWLDKPETGKKGR